jgi:peptide/nickel transport system permease protein
LNKFLNKAVYGILTIFLAVTTIFFVIRISPGDPIETILGPKATGAEIIKLKTQLGMDKPLIQQYFNYLIGVIKGDLGKSIMGANNVKVLIQERIGATFVIAFTTISISSVLGVFFGILAGFKKSNFFDFATRLITLFALSFPIFSLAPILVLFFSIKLKLLPVSEWGDFKHAILPVITLVIPLSSVLMRVTRNKFLEEVNFPWVTVLRAKGLSEYQILFRILKICLPTILTIISIQLSVVITGTMITETIFDIPGMGSLLFEGIQSRDYPIVQGVIIYSTLTYIIIYFLVDYINEIIDPRMMSVEEND